MYKTFKRLRALALAAVLTISAPTAVWAASAALPETPVSLHMDMNSRGCLFTMDIHPMLWDTGLQRTIHLPLPLMKMA